tara:strand:- start:2185 stop:3213 length:1029 start_codon:yes stop_codon:yes gene_type:complete
MLKLKKKNINHEKKFFIDLVFNEIKIDKNRLLKIDFEKLVLFVSERLMLPTLYLKLKEKKLLDCIPNDLKKYLKKIYQINYNRNLTLLNEVNSISHELQKNNINHIFIKGVSYIYYELYKDLGERMIGDIDLLIDFSQIKKAENIVNGMGYHNVLKYNFLNKRHIARKIKSNKLFAIELHYQLLDIKLSNFNEKIVLKNKTKIKECYFPNPKNLILYNIYSCQINDNNQKYIYANYRNFYDFNRIIKKNNDLVINNDKYINRYLLLIKKLNININILIEIREEFTTLVRLNMRKKLKLFLNLELCALKFYFAFVRIPDVIREIITNSDYRKYLISKLIFQKI